MIERVAKRIEAIARQRQRALVKQTAARLRTIFGDGAVATEEARVLVSGRGIIKRWLIDPNLRFLSGGMR